jgi:hypothetical protein
MSQKITISSVTANTPVDIYYCNSLSANCQYVASVEEFPFVFYVEPPYDEVDILVKIVDKDNFEDGRFIYITPTPTPSITPSVTPSITPSVTIGLTPTPTKTGTPANTPTNTQTPTNTKTNTPTPTTTQTQTQTLTPTITQTPTYTPTNTYTPTITPTNTQTPTNTSTPTVTPVVSIHQIGRTPYNNPNDSCLDTITTTTYYTYISDANTVPVLGVKIYTVLNNGVLYVPFNGLDGYLKMIWGVDTYSVKIDSYGTITDFVLCS